MRVVKPMQIGFLSRCFEHQRRFHLGVSVLVGFRFDRSVRLMSEVGIWKLVGDELGEQAVIDEGMPKSRAELLVRARAHTPGGVPQATCPVTVRVGDVEKTLYAVGDRWWRDGVPTEPVPFTAMELGWAQAYGGPGHAPNPLGKGASPVKLADGREAHPLPNVELPTQMVQSPSDRREPAGFMPFGFDWPQRRAKLGTYDERWLREGYPGYAADIDWSVFNVASPDQQREAPWVGDEPLACIHMHPTIPVLEGRLPGIQARCFVGMRGTAPKLTDVPLRATTVWLFPHLETGVVVFHGAHRVGEDDAADVEEIVLAAEDLGAPRPIEHYERILHAAIEREPDALLALIAGSGLVPDDCVGVAEVEGEMKELQPQGLLQQAQRRRAEAEHEAARARIVEAGLDPDEHGPPPLPPDEPPPTLAELPGVLKRMEEDREHQEREREARRLLLEDQARELCVEHDLDYDSIFLEKPGPPAFDAQLELEKMAAMLAQARAFGSPMPELEAQLGDPTFRQQIHDTEGQLHEAYRLSAHMNEKSARELDPDEAAHFRAELLALVRAGADVAGRDFTGIDLRGEDLSGANLAGAFLEQATLDGCDLRDADLTRAVLAGATLEGARLDGARLIEANLGRARLTHARAERGPDLTDATLDLADLTGATLHGARFGEAMFRECTLDGADLSGAELRGAMFYKCAMRGLKIEGADLHGATLVELDATGLVATGASLSSVTLYDVRADDSRLDRGRHPSFRACGKTSLARSSFEGSFLEKANFRGIDLSDANFRRADVSGGDLSEARFLRADLSSLKARGSLFIRTDFTEAKLVRADLLGALLSKANLTATDLSGANLYGADFARARSDGGTVLEGANQLKTRIHPVRST